MADQRAAYLDRLSDRLGLPEPWATDVRAEVASHLDDAIDQGRAAGLDEVAATREALARLGSPDALAEFKVQTSDYSAELGHGGGAVVNASIKSGTNAIHGKRRKLFPVADSE